MKEKIYTIPVNESFEQQSECPFCYLEKKLEKEAVEYALGAAMMEPDYRIISNEKGYCNKHLSMMLAAPNKLSLALVMETHLKEVYENFLKHKKDIESDNSKSKKLFSKKASDSAGLTLAENLNSDQKKCVICDKLNETMERYTDVFFYMWDKDNEMKEKVKSSKGFCMKHFALLCEKAYSGTKNPADFVRTIYDIQASNLERIIDDVHRFTLKFDYRNKDMEWGTAADAPIRSAEKLRGYIVPVKEEQN